MEYTQKEKSTDQISRDYIMIGLLADVVSSPVLQAEDVSVVRNDTSIFDELSLAVEPNASIVIQGPSGAGKTTLFEILGLLDTPSSGTIRIDGKPTHDLSERQLARLRREKLGFIFQDFQLVPDLTALDNAALPQEHTGERDEEWLQTIFETLNIWELRDRYPAMLSGGEKQRVAIARALANRPTIILADEPTGQLDPETANRVLELLTSLEQVKERALLVITHDRTLADRFTTRYELADGKLSEISEKDQNPPSPPSKVEPN